MARTSEQETLTKAFVRFYSANRTPDMSKKDVLRVMKAYYCGAMDAFLIMHDAQKKGDVAKMAELAGEITKGLGSWEEAAAKDSEKKKRRWWYSLTGR